MTNIYTGVIVNVSQNLHHQITHEHGQLKHQKVNQTNLLKNTKDKQ